VPIYKPTELFQFLESLGIAPRKGLSQNFLIDGNILRKIVQTASIAPKDLVLEIGPGPGSLTEELLNAEASVLAVEKDVKLAQALERLKTESNHLEVFCEDILKFPIETVFQDKVGIKVVANLPYHLTTPIIVRLTALYPMIQTIVVMVQEEVARRFVAKPGTSEYSSISVFLNFYADVEYGFTVGKNCFYPAPKVDSAIVVLKLKKPPSVSNVEHFFEMTRTAFHQRRKMLRSSLRELYSSEAISSALLNLKLNPLSRPENLSLNQFISLFEALQKDIN
jgi:16S rRNA (adenine1518-N6/adenine1519-N6)-dimethyltransferase